MAEVVRGRFQFAGARGVAGVVSEKIGPEWCWQFPKPEEQVEIPFWRKADLCPSTINRFPVDTMRWCFRDEASAEAFGRVWADADTTTGQSGVTGL